MTPVVRLLTFIWKISMAISPQKTGHPIHLIFGSSVGFSGSAERMIPVGRWTIFNRNIGKTMCEE